jgi:hypothetical protein
MTAQEIKDKWKAFVTNMNENGVPLPMLRADKKASLTATFAFLSFNIWVVSVIGKASGALGGMDTGACLQMFITCSCLHLGRKMQRDNSGAISLDDKSTSNSSESKAPTAKSDEILPG